MDSLTARFQKEVFYPYLEILKAQYRFHPVFVEAKKAWEEKLTAQELVNGPYLEKSQIYQAGKPRCGGITRENDGNSSQTALGASSLETSNRCIGVVA